MELRESRAQAAIARKEKNAAATKTAELKQALASVTKQNKVMLVFSNVHKSRVTQKCSAVTIIHFDRND